MSIYKQQTSDKGVIRYKKDGKFTKGAEVPAEVKNVLLAADDGFEVDETGTPVGIDDPGSSQYDVNIGEDSGIDETVVVKAPANSEEGMGFPRIDGKTVDIFNSKPHEVVKYIGGLMVPLTEENYKTKTDAEIIEKLKALGKL